jgi:hypothetical protein
MPIYKHVFVAVLCSAMLAYADRAQARTDEIKLRPGEWYDRVGATPFQPEGALDIVSYCGTALAPGADDSCVRAWVEAARVGRKHLYASSGDFTLTGSIPLFDGMHLRCKSPKDVVFRKRTGFWRPHFLYSTAALTDVSVEGCSFDMNGDPTNFAHSIGADEVSKLTYRGNRVFDGTGMRCSEHTCQRQYLIFKRATDILIENNDLSDGGRIKVGMPGRRLVIRHNFLRFINDNAITVVSSSGVSWPDGSNVSEDILIDGNTIVDAIGGGIFYGADGETGGKGVITQRVTIINNMVAGKTTFCILGTLPERASEIFVGNNRCHQGPSKDGFNSAIQLGRINNPTGAALRTTLWGNYVTAAAPRDLDGGGALFIKTGEACFVQNIVRRVVLAARVYEPAKVYALDNDWGGQAGVEEGGAQLTGGTAGCPCYLPPFLDFSGSREALVDPLAVMSRRCLRTPRPKAR